MLSIPCAPPVCPTVCVPTDQEVTLTVASHIACHLVFERAVSAAGATQAIDNHPWASRLTQLAELVLGGAFTVTV
ncbi:MAG: hypothetical protein JWO19_2133 [Bryobacterales bacterium]|nr:hypothetical protein [Bryobacterales bacterium]